MAQRHTGPRKSSVFMAPDSNFTIGISCVKIGDEDAPIMRCSVVLSFGLIRTDKELDLRRIRIIQARANAMECFDAVDLVNIPVNSGYICTCGRHIVHVNDVPLAVCQILTLPHEVSFEQR